MGYGKERPCKKCSNVKLIMARGLCSSCFSRLKNLGRLDEFPVKEKPAIKSPSYIAAFKAGRIQGRSEMVKKVLVIFGNQYPWLVEAVQRVAVDLESA